MADFSWKVGGAQGEGIDATGEVFILTMHRMGYFTYGYRHFMSLIKGGHTNYKVRISPHPRRHRGDDLNMLVAFDQQSIQENAHELVDGGVVIYDSSTFELDVAQGDNIHMIGVPLTDIAKEHGFERMKNMVAMGATAYVCQLPESSFDDFIEDRFGKYGKETVEKNREVVRQGYSFAKNQTDVQLELPELPAQSKGKKRLLMHGNDAIALGAVVAGCRILAAYPITPATDILYSALKLMPKYGGVVLQAEDEMAACQMAVGANFSGVRAMTSTSGPGLSLMTETLGVSGVSETPLVIVDVQRAGPSTGMPTKTEQADAFQAIFSSHGEIQRIVLTPGTVEECFYDMQRAFNLADKYQCPVIVVIDLALGLSKQSVELEDMDFEAITIDRGALMSPEEVLAASEEGGKYKRYRVTDSGISPRAVPGQAGGIHIAISYEHDEYGMEREDVENRMIQSQKRVHKMETLNTSEFGAKYFGDENPDLLFIGWGSTVGQIEEARDVLRAEGTKVGQLHLTALHPLPVDALTKAIDSAKTVVVVENNMTGQLAQLIRQELGYHDKLQTMNKWDGHPFDIAELVRGVKDAAKEVA